MGSLIESIMEKAERTDAVGFSDLLFCMQRDRQFAFEFAKRLTMDEILLLSHVLPCISSK